MMFNILRRKANNEDRQKAIEKTVKAIIDRKIAGLNFDQDFFLEAIKEIDDLMFKDVISEIRKYIISNFYKEHIEEVFNKIKAPLQLISELNNEYKNDTEKLFSHLLQSNASTINSLVGPEDQKKIIQE